MRGLLPLPALTPTNDFPANSTLVDPAAKNPLHPRSPQLIPTLSRHIPLAISPRRSTSSFLWCAPNSRTFVTLRPLRILSEVAVMELLDEAYSLTQSYIREYGDEVIWGGVFDWTTNGLHLRMQNANNHQLTFGVLGAALYAVSDFMTKNGWSAASFRVWDEEAWVGAGTVG